MELNDRELATVLAALRGYQGQYSRLELRIIATHDEQLEPLGLDEIDDLCERLNTGG